MASVYMYRLKFDGTEHKGEVGLAVVNDVEHLFWLLDEFCNPYDYEFCKAQPGDAIGCAVDFSDGNDGDESPWQFGPYDFANHTDRAPEQAYMSENVIDQVRQWRRFKYRAADEGYKTIKA